ncbi:hypothetical protein RRG08_000238 [Elysia crispata]|uniref:Uncharacterized protein n=1 Tax=Elysia crispata TaxID=231223 RepID=A0AAE1AWK4_9GAST|nr:hypothetical protein RRG08_000238 [Elysia crispata]
MHFKPSLREGFEGASHGWEGDSFCFAKFQTLTTEGFRRFLRGDPYSLRGDEGVENKVSLTPSSPPPGGVDRWLSETRCEAPTSGACSAFAGGSEGGEAPANNTPARG